MEAALQDCSARYIQNCRTTLLGKKCTSYILANEQAKSDPSRAIKRHLMRNSSKTRLQPPGTERARFEDDGNILLEM